jgi:ribosomal protein S18 acetylase RimI-like enzyme
MDRVSGASRRLLSGCSLEEAAAGFTEGFAGYVVPVNVKPEALRLRIQREDIDLDASEVFFDGEKPAGILLVARRGDISRISALGVGPSIRGKGFGRQVMLEAIEAARKRGERKLVLEVINSNERAAALYTGLGFEVTRKLVGFGRSGKLAAQEAGRAAECGIATAVDMLQRFADANPTWQTDPRCFRKEEAPLKGFTFDGKAAALLDDSGKDVRLYGLAVDPAYRRQGMGRTLADGLAGLYPGRKLYIIENLPEGLFDRFMRRTGWRKSRLTQSEMVLSLV